MTPSQLVMSILPVGAPVKLLMGNMLSDLDKNETLGAFATVVKSLAEKEGVSPDEFVKSGRAVVVMSALASGETPPPPGKNIAMDKCPKCNHVRYLIT